MDTQEAAERILDFISTSIEAGHNPSPDCDTCVDAIKIILTGGA